MRLEGKLTFGRLLGAKIEILQHQDPSLVGRKGIVVAESMKTLKILSEGKVITILKQSGKFKLETEGYAGTVYGDLMISRPEERTKAILRKKGGLR